MYMPHGSCWLWGPHVSVFSVTVPYPDYFATVRVAGGLLLGSSSMVLFLACATLLLRTRAWRTPFNFPGVLLGISAFFLCTVLSTVAGLIWGPLPAGVRAWVTVCRGVVSWSLISELVRVWPALSRLMVALRLAARDLEKDP